MRIETSPEDIHGMHAAEGILTTRGGMTSHAAVVARGMGKPCVSGAGAIRVEYDEQKFTVMGETVEGGDIITIDGASGQVMRGEIPTIKPELSGDFANHGNGPTTVAAWASAPMPKRRRCRRRASLARKALACAAPSTCSSKKSALQLCVR